MTQILYGPWKIDTHCPSDDYQVGRRMLIRSSDNADGSYELEATKFALDVQGVKWTITLETSWGPEVEIGGSLAPHVCRVARSLLHQRPAGLTIELAVDEETIQRGKGVRVHCVSTDPAINPRRIPMPYDFTLPEK